MALLIDADGKETVGGIMAIRDAFQDASGNKLACSKSTMRHGIGDSQILAFSGVWCADGRPFTVEEELPPGAPLAAHARRMARELIEKQ